jgi:hypothetical protein
MPTEDCFTSLKAMLAYTQAQYQMDLPAARKLQSISATATELLSGHYAKLAPFYDPLTPNFMSAVGAVNSSIVNGTASADTFNDYVGLLVVELNS